MISCTEFIPAYSELFTYIEEHYGRSQVDHFWEYLFKPDGKGLPLINFLEKEGIRGCFSYWTGTLNEEAADFTMYLNEKRGFFMIVMHKCPSKGRLLKLEEEIGIKPYHDYCLHCDHYRESAEKAGFKYIYNFQGIEHAACTLMIYDPAIFDGRVIIDEDTEIMDRKASDNEYFHPGFHNSMNRGVRYLGAYFGIDDIRAYLTQYTKNVYKPVIADMKQRGLSAIADKIQSTYAIEKCPDAVKTVLTENRLEVEVLYCPAVKFLQSVGYVVSQWYPCTTEFVMQALAEQGGYRFTMEAYDPQTGAAKYRFEQ